MEHSASAENLLPTWLESVKCGVDAHLREYFARKRAVAARLSEPSVALVDTLGEFTLRGGKRTRPAVLMAGYAAVAEESASGAVLDLAASLEILHAYLLVHDDWMDQDGERRGGPTVHRWFTDRTGNAHLGASLAILAGDLGHGFAMELVSLAEIPQERRGAVLAVFAQMQDDVVWGQQLDVLGHAEVELIHRLKTGSYSVRGPLLLGAALGGANPEQTAALERYAEPVGRAFQVRDDLLGVFGDPQKTGKPAGSDLRAGKRTAVVAEAERRLPAAERAPLTRVFGHADADEAAVSAATAWLERSGVRAAVEEQALGLYQEARRALEHGGLRPAGKRLLDELAHRFAVRES